MPEVKMPTTVSLGLNSTVKGGRSSYKISLSSVSGRHPLNVKPGGNELLLDGTGQQEFGVGKTDQMGFFSRLPEELVMEILTFVDDVASLTNLSLTSRVMYAYLYDEEVWRKLYVTKLSQELNYQEAVVKWGWRGSWRSTLIGIDEAQEAKVQLAGNLLCSDILYRPFQCSQVNYNKLFAKIIKDELEYKEIALSRTYNFENYIPSLGKGRILRIPENQLDLANFNDKFHDKPFVLVNSDRGRWPQWTLEQLNQQFSNVLFRQEAVQWPFSLYLQYLERNKDENPLYLFDCKSEAMKQLRQQYEAPKIFQHDLFTVFENDMASCRPDYAWLIIGPERSGSTFHKDPNYTSAWNTAITGKKLWIMFPPSVTPPGVSTDKDESEVTSPVGIAEWVISGFFNDSINLDQCLLCVTFPGECMYVPSGWWHSVINLDDSIALTQNFVPLPKLANALHFLRNKGDQISGFRPYQVKAALDQLVPCLPANDDSEITKLKVYKDQFETIDLNPTLQNEDCGEIDDSRLPPMPIYELFKQLLMLQGKEIELKQALDNLHQLEHGSKPEKTEKKAWLQIVNNSTTSELKQDSSASFFFGFALADESTDDDEEEENE